MKLLLHQIRAAIVEGNTLLINIFSWNTVEGELGGVRQCGAADHALKELEV